MVDTPNDALQSHKVSGQNSPRGRVGGQKSLKNPENPEKLSPARGGGYWDGRPLWDMSTYLHQHRRDITQTFMVDSPSDNLQTHKVFGRNSSRGGVGGPGRSKKTPQGRIKKSPRGRIKKSPRGCGPMEPCARDMRTTGAVRVRPTDQ